MRNSIVRANVLGNLRHPAVVFRKRVGVDFADIDAHSIGCLMTPGLCHQDLVIGGRQTLLNGPRCARQNDSHGVSVDGGICQPVQHELFLDDALTVLDQ